MRLRGKNSIDKKVLNRETEWTDRQNGWTDRMDRRTHRMDGRAEVVTLPLLTLIVPAKIYVLFKCIQHRHLYLRCTFSACQARRTG
jgi:hypothetical protein